jgi:hypothetical protein
MENGEIGLPEFRILSESVIHFKRQQFSLRMSMLITDQTPRDMFKYPGVYGKILHLKSTARTHATMILLGLIPSS